jgi:O-antigen ligase
MWRLSLMAYLPTLAFWGGQAWARRAFNTRPIDIGVVILALVCSSSVLLDVIGISEYELYGTRYFGFIGDSVAWILSFTVVYFTISKKYVLYNFIAIIALLFTQSLGASFVVVVALFIYYLKSNELRRRPVIILLNALLLLSVISYFGLLPLLLDRVNALDILDNDRVRTNAFTFSLILENYYFGGGYGIHGYSFEMEGFANLVDGLDLMGTPSSTYLQVLADSGLFGFFIFFTFILAVSRDSLRVISSTFSSQGARELSGLAAWLISFMLTNHTAAWLLPASKLSIIVFTVAGIVTASSIMPHRKCSLKYR